MQLVTESQPRRLRCARLRYLLEADPLGGGLLGDVPLGAGLLAGGLPERDSELSDFQVVDFQSEAERFSREQEEDRVRERGRPQHRGSHRLAVHHVAPGHPFPA